METTGNITEKKRNPGIEMLRVIAMLMIIVLHYNTGTDALLKIGIPASGVNIFANAMEAFCITGVNIYVLISGYFLSKGRVKPSRLFSLICQVYFYTIGISLVMAIVGPNSLKSYGSMYRIVEYVCPVSSEHYWFATAYIIMYVFAPVMNAAVDKLSRKQMKAVIIGLLTWFCFIKSVVPVLFPTDHFGYDYGWFICLYLIAAYIRKYNVVLFYSARNSAIVFLVSCAAIATMSISFYYINFNWGGFAHYQEVPFNFNFIFTLTGSLGLFSFFRFYQMRENKVADLMRFLGPLTFGVYLLHMHVEIRDRWVGWISSRIGEAPMYSVPLFAWHALRAVLIVFVAGIFVDWIRKMIFDYVGRVLHDSWLFKKIRALDEELC
jgi:surface polysaccharide O-acyltransferase-like enzyme